MAPGSKKQANSSSSSFVTECQDLFGTGNLYEILHLGKKTDDENKIKKAYYKASLKYHPDRMKFDSKSDDEAKDQENVATKKFQIIGKVYSILSDKEKRATYDETGVVDDEDNLTEVRDWEAYWRLLFKPVTLKDVKDFEKSYKGSDEERNDLKLAYTTHKGDMDKIMSEIMCCTHEDEHRFTEIIREMISAKEIPDFPKFTSESDKKKAARKRRAEKEAEEAEAELEKIKSQNGQCCSKDDSLAKMIQKRQSDRGKQTDLFFEHLTEKYTNEKGTKKKNKKGRVANRKT